MFGIGKKKVSPAPSLEIKGSLLGTVQDGGGIFASLFSAMNEGVAIHEVVRDKQQQIINYRIIEVNPAFETQTGVSEAAVHGKLATEAYGVAVPPFLAEYAEVVETGNSIRFNTVFEPLQKTFSISVVALGNDSFATIFTDITVERAQQKLLRESEERLRVIFEHSPEGLYMRRLDGIFLEANKALLDIIGYPREAVIGRSLHELGVESESDIKRVSDILTRLKQNELSKPIELKVKPKDGTVIAIEVRIAPIMNGNEKVLYGIVHDLSQERKVQNKIQQLSQAVDQSPASVVITDTEGNIEYVNAKFTEVTGYTAEEALGKNPRILQYGDTPKEMYQQLWNAITHGGEWKGELHNKTKSGEAYWENVNITAIKNAEGNAISYLAVKEDITEHKREELEKIKSSERIKQQSEALIAISKLINQEDLDYHQLIQQMIRLTADTLGVSRVSNWKLAKDGLGLELVDAYDQSDMSYQKGILLSMTKGSKYLDALKAHRAISTVDVLADDRLAEFLPYFKEHAIASLLDASIRVNGQLTGVLCVETRQKKEWTSDDAQFAREITDQLAQVVINHEKQLVMEQFEKRSLELEQVNRVMVGRELRMVELKKEIERLKGGAV